MVERRSEIPEVRRFDPDPDHHHLVGPWGNLRPAWLRTRSRESVLRVRVSPGLPSNENGAPCGAPSQQRTIGSQTFTELKIRSLIMRYTRETIVVSVFQIFSGMSFSSAQKIEKGHQTISKPIVSL